MTLKFSIGLKRDAIVEDASEDAAADATKDARGVGEQMEQMTSDIEIDESQPHHDVASERTSGVRRTSPALVLVVDDSPDNREMYVQFLELTGYRVIEAADGLEAISRAQNELPDAIVMDLTLPGMSGWEALAVLKADDRTEAIPVLALSGHVIRAARAQEAGFKAVLEKPCLPDDLARIVAELVASDASHAPHASTG